MKATRQEITAAVIGPLEINFRCKWNRETNPREYGELVAGLVASLARLNLTAEQFADGMANFVEDWDKTRWPIPRELVDFLQDKPAYEPGSNLPQIPNGRAVPVPLDYDLQREIKHAWLEQVVSAYGNPDAPEVDSPAGKIHNAYHADNGIAIRCLMWQAGKIEDLTRTVQKNPGTDWWNLLTNILPTPKDIEAARYMEQTDTGGSLKFNLG